MEVAVASIWRSSIEATPFFPSFQLHPSSSSFPCGFLNYLTFAFIKLHFKSLMSLAIIIIMYGILWSIYFVLINPPFVICFQRCQKKS